jgi:hypothetical protein
MDDSADRLAPPRVDKTHETLKAFVAPVAHESDAVTKDPRALVMAQSVYAAFGEYGATGGLTRNQIASACAKSVPREVFESRFDLLVSMGFLYRYADKSHQMHYAINPDGVTGLLVFGRATKAGGIEEIMLLLGHAREELQAGTITVEQLTAELNRARHGLAIYSGHLLHLTEARTWEELIAERARHRSANALVELANDLVRITSSHFRELSGAGSRLVDEALRYHYAVTVFMERLYKQASARRDFSMLMPEQYRSAALQCTQEELAAPSHGRYSTQRASPYRPRSSPLASTSTGPLLPGDGLQGRPPYPIRETPLRKHADGKGNRVRPSLRTWNCS